MPPSKFSKTFIQIIKSILLGVQIIASLLLISSISRLNLLDKFQFLLLNLFLIAIFLLNFWLLFHPFTKRNSPKKPAMKKSHKLQSAAKAPIYTICGTILSIVASILCYLGLTYSHQTITFIENATNIHYETQQYSVLALKTSGYDRVEQLSRQHVGFLDTNPNLKQTQSTLKKVVDCKAGNYAEIGSLIAALTDHQVATIVLSDDYLDFLTETQPDFLATTKTIFTF